MNLKHRSKILVSVLVAGLATAAVASADPAREGAKHECEGKHGDKAARFQRADKNGDGALSADEVGAEKWQRIQVADQNGDGKVTREELHQAKKDGKLPRRGGGAKQPA